MLILAVVACASAPTAAAAPGGPQDAPIVIGATTLDIALLDLARQTGVEIVSTEDGLKRVRVGPIAGRMRPRVALARLLAGTGFRAIALTRDSFRIVAATVRPVPPSPPLPVRPPPGDIIVTASKQRVPLLRFPGSLTTLTQGAVPGSTPIARDLSGMAQANPILQTTALGAGRNKLFIRGIADSSFNGATQSTASFYFGDVPLGYSGPEPALALVDIGTIEVMEGPQGTLYGAGAIGGVVRITPNPARLDRVEGAVRGEVSLTAHGAPSDALSAVVNLPIADGTVGLRLVGYQAHDGGYIDDRGPRAADVNGVDRIGGRIALRVDPAPGWRIDVTGAGQRIAAHDGQYAQTRQAPLTRVSRIAQPYSNGIAFARLVMTKRWDSGLELVSATGIAHSTSDDRFDASRAAPTPLLQYTDSRGNLLLSHETRLSRSMADGRSWVLGIGLLRDSNTQDRTVGPPGSPVDIAGVTNVARSISVFGEVTRPLLPALSATIGFRGTRARIDGSPTLRPRPGDIVRGRQTSRIDPTVALSWALSPRIAVYGRVQTGFRTGGLAVARGIGRVAEFAADSITMGEAGLRMVRHGDTGLAFSTAVSIARWRAIQADVVDRRGLPYTANIGDAQIATVEARGDWVPVRGLTIDAALLYTDNVVTGAVAATSPGRNRRLPMTPAIAAHVGASHRFALGGGEMRIGGGVDYTGRSVLGTGDYLDISQGRYAVATVEAGWTHGGLDVAIGVDNLGNARANRFALGNPFGLAARDQITPLRPRTVRLSVGRAF